MQAGQRHLLRALREFEQFSLPTELGQFGPGGRALYDPRPGDPARWDWAGDSP
ncbi:hypothetical protein OG787_12005 [Streptomyces sp. NBC_00075]|uniref:hypothetical protein n=1 Tax=Streptomyces sp. NBC_00075 TaxID=2975641 RepID=UPI0032458831